MNINWLKQYLFYKINMDKDFKYTFTVTNTIRK